MYFSCTSTLKSICVSCILKALFPTHDFVTWCIHLSFGKYWFTEFYTRFPIGDTFYYRIWKKILFFVNTTIELIKHIFKLGSWQAHDGRYNFSKTLIFTWKLWTLLWATNTVSCFSWSDRLTWLIFVNMSASYVSLNKHSSPITYPLKLKWCFMKTEASLAHNSITEVLFFQSLNVYMQ